MTHPTAEPPTQMPAEPDAETGPEAEDAGPETEGAATLADERERQREEMRARLEGTNVNPQTLLATDYLNHLNEIVMTMEMLPDMPELMEDARAWQPKTYRQHFEDSGLSDSALTVEAYQLAPPHFRRAFDTTIAQMSRVALSGVRRVDAELNAGNDMAARTAATESVALLRRLIDQASAIIHGDRKVHDQSEIDRLLSG